MDGWLDVWYKWPESGQVRLIAHLRADPIRPSRGINSAIRCHMGQMCAVHGHCGVPANEKPPAFAEGLS